MRYCIPLFAAIAITCLAGCQSESGNDNGSVKDRQDAAMKDPFNYGPNAQPAQGPQNPQAPKKPTTPATPTRDNSTRGEWDRFWNP